MPAVPKGLFTRILTVSDFSAPRRFHCVCQNGIRTDDQHIDRAHQPGRDALQRHAESVSPVQSKFCSLKVQGRSYIITAVHSCDQSLPVWPVDVVPLDPVGSQVRRCCSRSAGVQPEDYQRASSLDVQDRMPGVTYTVRVPACA